jgi:hypothetical protein
LLLRRELQDVFPGDAARDSGPGDLGDIDTQLFRDGTDDR